ncbi:MAG: hypothetical protein PHX34_05455 [Candidatus Shapirobacteria bacterium]|nr:hypothetical protein [Candidatus Shapirobacteria bacterium]
MEKINNQSGISSILLIFIILFLLIGGFIAADFAYIDNQKKQNIYPTPTPAPNQVITPVTAHGTFSKDKYTVNVVLNFNLEGGVVSGEFSGDCSGSISGNYDGQDYGVITGKAVGSCDPFLVPIPASANFSGTVSHQQKSVSISGTGSAVGVSGSGSLFLIF